VISGDITLGGYSHKERCNYVNSIIDLSVLESKEKGVYCNEVITLSKKDRVGLTKRTLFFNKVTKEVQFVLYLYSS
jgi:hypothetical protein